MTHLLNHTQVANVLGLRRTQIHTLVRRRAIPTVQLPLSADGTRFDPADLAGWIESLKQKPEPPSAAP